MRQTEYEAAADSQPQPVTLANSEVGADKPHEIAIRGWASPLAISVTALLLIQAVTGLWIYLAPFSIGSQFQVLLHVVAGVASVGPYLWYQLRHWLAWRGQKLTAEMVLGYLLMVMVLMCMASGLWLAWQAAMGPRISRLWDLVHLVSGLGALVLVVVHLVSAFLRRRPQMRQWAELRASVHRFALGVTVWSVATAAGLLVAIPALVAYRYLRGRVDELVIQMEKESIKLVQAIDRTSGTRPSGAQDDPA